MTSRLLLLTVLVGLAACDNSGHPTGRATIPELDGVRVATVEGRRITADEVQEFAATRDDATIEALVEREALAVQAVEHGIDVELVRKRAMIQAFLSDEIEGAVGPKDIPKDVLDHHREEARAALYSPGGLEIVAVRLYAREIINGTADDARRAALVELLTETANEMQAGLPDENAVDAAWALSGAEVDPSVEVNVLDLKIPDPSVQKPARGYARMPRMFASLQPLADGAKSPVFVVSDSPVFAVRKARIEPRDPTDEEVEKEAVKRGLADVRTKRMAELQARLRDQAVLVFHKDALEETM